MSAVRKQWKKILGLTSVAVVLIGAIAGITVKNNTPKTESVQVNNIQDSSDTNLKKRICKDFFEANENEALSKGYSEKDVVDCSFVGCGGIF